jgi:hypothetical protein
MRNDRLRALDSPAARPIDDRVGIGHAHLKVADLERALAFYCGVLGFELMQRISNEAAFLSAGGYHHHLGLNTWESRGGKAPAPGTTGLYHVAILYPDRASLADALRRLAPAIMAFRRLSISTTRTATGSNSITTARPRTGRATRAANSRCSRVGSMSRHCARRADCQITCAVSATAADIQWRFAPDP